MKINENVLTNDEKNILSLRNLYSKYGYISYKMSKFEEYDLYSKNKDFLVSDTVITFTDTNGKLLALKPDVTLSIIKNTEDDPTVINKVCYNENVYRVSKGTNSYKEIMQVGLECIGDIDAYNISEVLYLACESLNTISNNYILDVCSLDLINKCLSIIDLPYTVMQQIIKCIGEKNTNEIINICKENKIDESKYIPLIKLLRVSSRPKKALIEIKNIANEIDAIDSYNSLSSALEGIDLTNIRIDFSVILDLNYYNGIVFKGFIQNVPGSVLSGGQYDKLMKKMKKKSKAIGFAVYLDLLDYIDESNNYDVDLMILYKNNDKSLKKYIKEQIDNNQKIFVTKSINKKIKYKKLVQIENGEVMTIEDNS